MGIYRDGELDGEVTETDSDGFLLSRGQYRRGVPTGEWTIYYRDGGRLIGPVSATTGLITGAARYHYPDDSELRGTWQVGIHHGLPAPLNPLSSRASLNPLSSRAFLNLASSLALSAHASLSLASAHA